MSPQELIYPTIIGYHKLILPKFEGQTKHDKLDCPFTTLTKKFCKLWLIFGRQVLSCSVLQPKTVKKKLAIVLLIVDFALKIEIIDKL